LKLTDRDFEEGIEVSAVIDSINQGAATTYVRDYENSCLL